MALRVPKPARGLLDVRGPTPWWWWALGALVALVLGLLAWWLSRRWGRRKAQTADPYLAAGVAFGRVERLRLIEAGEPGRHAALMTDVVRHYLSERIEGVSLALTSAELLAALRGSATVSSGELQAVLSEVDAVKFAAAPLAADRARSIGEEAKAIVRAEHTRAEALAQAAATPEDPQERAA